MATRHQLTQWRKGLERRGWRNAAKFQIPRGVWIEYHAVWGGRLVSGRCEFGAGGNAAWWVEGSPEYLLLRRQDVLEAVWRYTRRRRDGQVIRPLPR